MNKPANNPSKSFLSNAKDQTYRFAGTTILARSTNRSTETDAVLSVAGCRTLRWARFSAFWSPFSRGATYEK